MEIRDLLWANSTGLLRIHRENINHVLDLQASLIRDILPSVVDEFGLGPDATEWATEWLSDTGSIFRIARYNKFTRSFALESIRKNLAWRLQNLWPTNSSYVLPPAIRCLPRHIHDPCGRPILVVESLPVNESPEVVKSYIIQAFEGLRLHLKSLSGAQDPEEGPVLQYIILLDLAKLSLQSLDIDAMTWTIREVIPRFPGMLAAVFIINYSWAHSGLWSIIKHLLPKSSISKIFFPTKTDLLTTLSANALPKDYGGNLPFLKDLDDPLRPRRTSLPEASAVGGEVPSAISHQPTSGYVSSISPTSLLNPFYGYPATSIHGYPQLHHSRRRKRDLARTLAWLFWLRWRSHISGVLVLTTLALALNLTVRKGFWHVPDTFLGWRFFLSSYHQKTQL